MKIVADENIPYLKDFFKETYELILKPGREIQPADLVDADILLVRSVTTVDKNLLENAPVKFVGSTTQGQDHLDVAWLTENNIAWYVAKGCNSRAVVEYVICVIAALEKQALLPETKLKAVVVGVGEIGSQVVTALQNINFEVLQCDPARALQEKDFPHVPFEQIENVDLVTFHVPLTRESDFPTYHLADKNFFLKQKKNCVIVNASRGAVVDSDALKEYGQLLYACLDVFENEPYIDFEVLALATIATPHIAGYSIQAKLRGIKMVYEYMLEQKIILPLEITIPEYPTKTFSFASQKITWQEAALAIFDPMELTIAFKQAMIEDESSATFDNFRKKFTTRYEFKYCEILKNPAS